MVYYNNLLSLGPIVLLAWLFGELPTLPQQAVSRPGGGFRWKRGGGLQAQAAQQVGPSRR